VKCPVSASCIVAFAAAAAAAAAGAQQFLSHLSSLARLQTLKLNFACCSIASDKSDSSTAATGAEDLQQQQQQPGANVPDAGMNPGSSSSSNIICSIERATMEEAKWAQVAASLQRCSRLRRVVIGPERPISEEQQLALQQSLPNCMVHDVV
jgi:hypothetical protein